MPDMTPMRQLLGRLDPTSALSAQDHDLLCDGDSAVTGLERQADLRTFADALETVSAQANALGMEASGESFLNAVRALRSGRSTHRAAGCRDLDSPRFTIRSPTEDVRNTAGKVMRFSRADPPARTLEVAAAVGQFGGIRWPAEGTFILGVNSAEARIGGLLALPPHGLGTTLSVSVQLQAEYVLFDGSTTPATATSLLPLLRGAGDMPLRGAVAGWARAGLRLHAAGGSSGTSVEFVSKWANRDGSNSQDNAPGGRVNLRHMVAVSPQTSSVAVFVGLECFAAAEETDELFRGGFSLFECRDKPVGELTGVYVPPARFRVRRVTAELCELPVLLSDR